MNIKEAKEEIKNTVKAYLRKDDVGNYRIPTVRQRPILLIGPPGIGKTAIVNQAANELGIGFVAYTMTHHTRQSAVGLPVLIKKEYEGETFTATEYTMSEIISSVYECMERSGCREGLLFIDEINCVSETLIPTMLQFLQNKTFGAHRVPKGWVIIAAGNPQEYNHTAREFDIVTLDRVRMMDIKEDYEVWKEYAYGHNVHPAILSWLNMHPDRFYYVKDTGAEKHFVTARGWEDLSVILQSYEEMGVEDAYKVIPEYIRDPAIAGDFSSYYVLYRKYLQDYRIMEILQGICSGTKLQKLACLAAKGNADERLAVTGMIVDGWNTYFETYKRESLIVHHLSDALEQWEHTEEEFHEWMEQREKALLVKSQAELVAEEELTEEKFVQHVIRSCDQKIREMRCRKKEEMTEILKSFWMAEKEKLSVCVQEVSAALDRGFSFAEQAFGEGMELTLLTSDLLQNPSAAEFIGKYGCDRYFAHSDVLFLEKERREILDQAARLQAVRDDP